MNARRSPSGIGEQLPVLNRYHATRPLVGLEVSSDNGQPWKSEEGKHMSPTMTHFPVDYVASSRRHLKDAHILMHSGCLANAGQLLGFTIECGLKGLLVACGVPTDLDGGIPSRNSFRQHMPLLNDRLVSSGHLIPNGSRSAHYRAMVPSVGTLRDWSVDHRYFKESALPLTSLPQWDLAALEMNEMLDQAVIDGVL